MALGIFYLMPHHERDELHELHDLELHGSPPSFLFIPHCREIVIAPGEPSVWQHVRDMMIAKGLLTGLWAWTGHTGHTYICIQIHSSPADTHTHTKHLPQGTAITGFKGGLPSPRPVWVHFYYKHKRIRMSESGLGASWSWCHSTVHAHFHLARRGMILVNKPWLRLPPACRRMHNGPLKERGKSSSP